MVYENHKKIVICYSHPKQDSNQIKPKEFIAWAKSDIRGGDNRGRGNALGNIKKAIHSRIDEIIASTHLVYAKDWLWRKIYTEDKLFILRKIGIKKTAIAAIITDNRNTYEHKYLLLSFREIEAYCESADLWLEDSYRNYNFGRIGIFDLPVYEVVKEDDVITKIVLTDEYKDTFYFWDYKRSFFKTSKDRSLHVTVLKDLLWKDILSLEKGFIKSLKNKEIHYLSQSEMTKIFKMYDKKVNRRFVGFLKTGTHVTL